jgi:hypothetical protein
MLVCRDFTYLIILLPLLTIITLILYMSGLDITPAMSATNNMNSTIPSVKMIYANHSYDMLPFVVLNEEGVKKLNFPHLPDQYKPEVVMASDKNFTFQFSKTPREINAFGIDYEADTTEVTPLTKTGKNQFTFGNVHGILTLEVRSIYDDGSYVTYTCLVDVKNTAADGNQAKGLDIFA